MSRAPEGQASFWVETTPETDYPALAGDLAVDVAVVGGGITGLTAATLLRAAGKTVAVLESRRVARGASGFTTAKITAGHGLTYGYLESRFGEDGAWVYAQSQQAAVEQIARLVEGRGIDCDFERKANYVYAETADEVQQVRDEVDTARRAGLDVSFVEETPLPYPVAGAVRLENQAQFHPRRYLLALAEAIPGDGSHLFEHTRVLDVSEGEPCTVETDHGEVRAGDVVVATHLPILDRGLFFAKTYPHRSYAVAAPIDAAAAPDGMFINAGTPTRSVRVLRDGERAFVQVGGQGHKTGTERDTPKRYRVLEEFLRRHWPQAGEIEYRWSTQDFMSADKVPYIGRLRRRSRHLYVGTGYTKWGMSSGTLAGMLVSDAILGRRNEWAGLYDAKRLKPRASASTIVKENSSAGAHFVGDRLTPAERAALDELANGEGAVVRSGARKRAAYRDDEGRLHVLSPVCRHLGCIVGWNPAERTWDCPCHGSRYAATGEVVHGPATEGLKRLD